MTATGVAPGGWERLPARLGYDRIRQNVIELVSERSELATVTVPACHGWTVRDLVDHLVDVCRQVTLGIQVLPLRHPEPDGAAGVPELLERWTELSELLPPLTEGLRGPIMTMDALTHELDLRRAIGAPVPLDHPAYPGSLDLVALGMGLTVAELGLPAMRVRSGGQEWRVGPGEPGVTVSGHHHDVFRSLTGRRTLDQIGALSWSGPAERWLPAFTWWPFSPPAEPTEQAVQAR
ncbi:maleylpyruvate isomerase family mycothiol-dependent enzyme [Kitasatospora sp. NPDC101801]|uniref:maleylpyruvate isomerase family mycothiol-dependent enzyme n=1 Tax=Kitasatospora sp. NPDC101801 TaxID=3364103 RepID=UPI00381EF65D